MSRRPGQKDPGPRHLVVGVIHDGGFFYSLSCGHIVEREPKVVARWRNPPEQLCCDKCGKPKEPKP